MGMIYFLVEASDKEIEALLADPERIETFLDEAEPIDLGKDLARNSFPADGIGVGRTRAFLLSAKGRT